MWRALAAKRRGRETVPAPASPARAPENETMGSATGSALSVSPPGRRWSAGPVGAPRCATTGPPFIPPFNRHAAGGARARRPKFPKTPLSNQAANIVHTYCASKRANKGMPTRYVPRAKT